MRRRIALPAVIALGSNLGDRERTLRDAVRAIDALDGVRVIRSSGIVQSPALTPAGIDDSAPAYLNAVIVVHSALPPELLLPELHRIEERFGRERLEQWGDRTLDLDLIDYAGLVRSSDELTLPHPRAWQRAFVLAPWLQVQPDARITGHGSVAELRAAATDPVSDYPAETLMPRREP